MEFPDEQWQDKVPKRKKLYRKVINSKDKNELLGQLPGLHQEAFEKIDCLDCAACCKNFSPRFKPPDIRRISKHLKMKESEFINAYLRRDEDGDYVVTSKPCPFLSDDHMCTIYDKRPSDCARFPYTNEDVFYKKPSITLKNVTFCPAVYYVLERLAEYPKD